MSAKKDGCLVCGNPADPETYCSPCMTSFKRLLKGLTKNSPHAIDRIIASIKWAGRRAQKATEIRCLDNYFQKGA